jgi:hypothetical protein
MPRNDVRRSSWRRTFLMRCCVDRRQCRGNRFRTQSRAAQLRPHLLRRQYSPSAIGITTLNARFGCIALLAAVFARRSVQTKTFAGVQCEVDVKNRYSTYQIADAANEGARAEQCPRSFINVIQFIANKILVRQHHHHEKQIVTHRFGQVIAESLEHVEQGFWHFRTIHDERATRADKAASNRRTKKYRTPGEVLARGPHG